MGTASHQMESPVSSEMTMNQEPRAQNTEGRGEGQTAGEAHIDQAEAQDKHAEEPEGEGEVWNVDGEEGDEERGDEEECGDEKGGQGSGAAEVDGEGEVEEDASEDDMQSQPAKELSRKSGSDGQRAAAVLVSPPSSFTSSSIADALSHSGLATEQKLAETQRELEQLREQLREDFGNLHDMMKDLAEQVRGVVQGGGGKGNTGRSRRVGGKGKDDSMSWEEEDAPDGKGKARKKSKSAPEDADDETYHPSEELMT